MRLMMLGGTTVATAAITCLLLGGSAAADDTGGYSCVGPPGKTNTLLTTKTLGRTWECDKNVVLQATFLVPALESDSRDCEGISDQDRQKLASIYAGSARQGEESDRGVEKANVAYYKAEAEWYEKHKKKNAKKVAQVPGQLGKLSFEVSGFWVQVEVDASAMRSNDCGKVDESVSNAKAAAQKVEVEYRALLDLLKTLGLKAK